MKLSLGRNSKCLYYYIIDISIIILSSPLHTTCIRKATLRGFSHKAPSHSSWHLGFQALCVVPTPRLCILSIHRRSKRTTCSSPWRETKILQKEDRRTSSKEWRAHWKLFCFGVFFLVVVMCTEDGLATEKLLWVCQCWGYTWVTVGKQR